MEYDEFLESDWKQYRKHIATWQENHKRFFTIEGEAMGYVFTEDMPVVFEDFKVVYKR